MLDVHILHNPSETEIVKSQMTYDENCSLRSTNKGEGFSMRLYLTMLNAYCDFLKSKFKFLRGNVRTLMCECISNCNFMWFF